MEVDTMDIAKKQLPSIRDYMIVIFSHKAIILACFVMTFITVSIALEMRTIMYEGKVTMLIAGRKMTEAEHYKEISNVGIETSQVASEAVVERVVKALKLNERPIDYEIQFYSKLKAYLSRKSIEEKRSRLKEMTPEVRQKVLLEEATRKLMGNISVRTSGEVGSSVFQIYVTDYSFYEAARIANSVSRSYVIFDLEQQALEYKLKYGDMHMMVQQLQFYIKNFEKNLDGKPMPPLEAIGPASIKIINQAKVSPVFMKPSKGVARFLAIVMGISAGMLIAFSMDYFDSTIKTPRDVITHLDLPFLGSLPKMKKDNVLVMQNMNLRNSKCAIAFERTGDNIYLKIVNANHRSILITDVEGTDQTSAVTANLGIYLSRDLNRKVLILDANLRTPSLSRMFQVSDSIGLIDVIEGRNTIDQAIINVEPNLYVVSTRKYEKSPIALLDSPVMHSLMKRFEKEYDMVLVDCSVDSRSHSDVALLSSITDAVILVLYEGMDRIQGVKLVTDTLKDNRKSTYVILNDRKIVVPKIIYKIT